MTQGPDWPVVDDEARQTRLAAAVVASIVLVIVAACVFSFSWVLTTTQDTCPPLSFYCAERPPNVAQRVAQWGSVGSVAVALTGAWVWPRVARSGWIIFGYVGVLLSSCVGVVIVSSTS